MSLVPSRNSDECWTSVQLLVNGLDLIEIVTRYERDRAFDIAGGYDWRAVEPYPEDLRSSFVGLTDGRGQDDRTILFVCAICRIDGCWDLRVRVERDERSVRWLDFYHPHRVGRDYSGLEFVFDSAGYTATLDRAIGPAIGSICWTCFHYCRAGVDEGWCPCCLAADGADEFCCAAPIVDR